LGLSVLIVGGGISGLSLAYLLSKDPALEITVLEAREKPGGKILTDRSDGYLTEWGVNGFLDNKPKTLELSAMLSLEPLRSSDAARKRLIFSDSALHQLPESPPAFLKSGLMSLAGKLRIGLETIIPRGGREDESLADFARRRLGKEAYQKFIDPMASGIYAGDPEALSLKSCFPRIHELEERYGSLIRAMVKLMAERKKSVSAAPAGVLTSFYDGMQVIINALKEAMGGSLRNESRAVSLEKTEKGYAVHLSDGSRREAEAVVLAAPAYEQAGILRDMDVGLSRTLGEVPYPSLAVVCTAFRKEKLRGDFNAFGFLVPHREGRRVLGTLYDSSIFPNRAPEGHVLLRTMVGGARSSHLAEQDEEKIIDMVLSELGHILGTPGEPDFVKVYRHEKAIPQYNVGHAGRVAAADAFGERHRGLYLAGNSLRGVSVNDCIEHAFTLSEKITKEVA
jgi:oxygen-dependent protoporphyrinogen oxidase